MPSLFDWMSHSWKKKVKSTPTRLSTGVSYEKSNLRGKTIYCLKSRPHFTI